MATDRNIRRMTRKFGSGGYGVFVRLLEAIYKEGHFARCTRDFIFDIADSLNMDDGDETYVEDVIKCCVECDLFDAELYSQGILTSHGIQTRYFEAKEASLAYAQSNGRMPEYEYLLIDINDYISDRKPDEEKEKPKSEPKNQKSEPKKCSPKSEDELRFDDWMKQNYPFIAKMARPLTLAEYRDLCSTFGEQLLGVVMCNLNNYRQINKKYTYAKQTITNWCKSEAEKHQTNARPISNSQQDLATELAAISANRRQG